MHNHPLNQQQQQQPSSSAAAEEATTTAADARPPLATQSSSTTNHSDTRKASISNTLNRAAEVFILQPRGSKQFDLLTFLADTRPQIQNYLLSRVSSQQSVLWYFCLQNELGRFSATEDNIRSRPHFRSRTYVLLNQETFDEHDLNEALQKIIESL